MTTADDLISKTVPTLVGMGVVDRIASRTIGGNTGRPERRKASRNTGRPGKRKVTKMNTTDRFMNEVILYGGLPLTHANVYRQCLKDTGSRKAADMFAFGQRVILASPGTEPLTLAQFNHITRK